MREILIKNSKLRDFSELSDLKITDIFTKKSNSRHFSKDLQNRKILFHNLKGVVPHNNYMDYLKIAYNTDYGIVIKPDFVWYTILCEISYMVNKDPDTFRKFFTYEKEGKIEIVGSNDSFIHMPVQQLLEMVLEILPADIQKQDIIPPFTTSDDDSRFAFALTFLETVQNYYEYAWYGCNYNKIKILGKKSDYELMLNSLDRFNRITPLQDYITQAKEAVQNIITYWKSDKFWVNILWTEKGYGGDIVDGWFKNLFYQGQHWHEHLSKVEAKELVLDNTLITMTGILSSRIEDGYLVPNFERIILMKDELEENIKEPDWKEFLKYDSLFVNQDPNFEDKFHGASNGRGVVAGRGVSPSSPFGPVTNRAIKSKNIDKPQKKKSNLKKTNRKH